jgi:uncharacterized protein (TIGR02444 family)
LAPDVSREIGTDTLQYDNEFWRFSLAVYGQAEVAQECLKLQQALGVDVNLLLFCAWLGARSMVLSGAEIETASRIVAAWHENVVRPLRGVRQQIKLLDRTDFEIFRAKVKSIELEAEQVEQAILFAYSKRVEKPRADHGDAVAKNVNDYIEIKSGGVSARTSELSAPRLIDAARHISA